MRINHNIPALRSQHSLGKTNGKMDKVMERLSSGMRINRAGDDAAGLAIANKMQTQVRGLRVASRNALDGVSLVQTAEGALSEVQSMLQRMRELSIQAANGTLAPEDRRAIQNEVEQLKDEITKTADLTEFNKIRLLNGQIDRRSFTNNEGIAKSVYISDTVQPGDYRFNVTNAGLKAQATGQAAEAFPTNLVGLGGRININGEEVQILDTDSGDVVFQKLRDLCERVDVTLTRTAGWGNNAAGGELKMETKEYGSDQKIQVQATSSALLTRLGLQNIAAGTAGATDRFQGTDAKVTLDTGATSDFTGTSTWTARGNRLEITDANYQKMYIDIPLNDAGTALKADPLMVVDPTTGAVTGTPAVLLKVLDAGPLQLQVGPNEGMKVQLQVPELTGTALGLDRINMRTAAGASQAIGILDIAINEISSVRSKLGAYQNRLEHTIANLDSTNENTTAALSRIQDADMAFEMAEYTQKNILAQAGVSMLAQANQRPQAILQLLQG